MPKCPQARKYNQFRVTIHDSAAEFRLALDGDLTVAGTAEAEQCWRTAESTIASRSFIVDLSGLRSLDGAAEDLLTRMAANGARFAAGELETTDAGAAIAYYERAGQGKRRRFAIADVLGCLLFRLRAWTWRAPATLTP